MNIPFMANCYITLFYRVGPLTLLRLYLMQVVVLLMTGGNDTIADSTEVDVGLCLNNQVTMDISPKKVKCDIFIWFL